MRGLRGVDYLVEANRVRDWNGTGGIGRVRDRGCHHHWLAQ